MDRDSIRRCAFLTMTDQGGYVIDDDRAYEPLRALGWSVEAVPWNRPEVAWAAYDLVVIRSTWDYHHDLEGFLAVLAEIERRGVLLENELPLVRWNLHKTYLRDLAGPGSPGALRARPRRALPCSRPRSLSMVY